ncbi:MAG TPA: GAF domain-containing sensor histidine kinase [Nannocystaceae bacterium]|nr:GAF domain-containing sensor histidine kinase [Nannocystaceae bacterium]
MAGTEEWRAQLLDAGLLVLGVGLTLALVVVLPLMPPPRFAVPLLAIALSAAVAFAMRAARGLPPVVRSGCASLSALGTGMTVMSQTGLGPGVPLALALIGAVLSIAIGRKIALVYLLASALGYVVIGLLVVERGLPIPSDTQDPHLLGTWIRWAAVFFVAAGALTWLVHAMVARLERDAQERAVTNAEQQRCNAVLLDLARHRAFAEGDVDAAFAAITEAGARALEASHVSVWRVSEDGTMMECADQYARATGHAHGETLHATDYPRYFAALAQGRALATSDARTDPRTSELRRSYLEPHGVVAMLDVPVRFGDRLVGVVCHEQIGGARRWSPEAEACAASLGDLAALAIAAAERRAREHELRGAYDQLGRLHRRVESAKEDERRHLARELHDELGQSLTALKLRLQMAKRGTTPDEQLGAAIGVVDDLIDRTRRLSLDLRPPLLDEAGLAAAVRAYLESNAALAEVDVALDTGGLERELPPEIETAAFRVVQESLTNVVRHAHARHVDVALRVADDRLQIRVRDDGRGFDRAVIGRHFGVLGMTERVRGLGGTFTIESRAGEGTTVDASLPLAPPE